MAKEKRECTCGRYCHGGKEVSLATWRKHAPWRRQDVTGDQISNVRASKRARLDAGVEHEDLEGWGEGGNSETVTEEGCRDGPRAGRAVPMVQDESGHSMVDDLSPDPMPQYDQSTPLREAVPQTPELITSATSSAPTLDQIPDPGSLSVLRDEEPSTDGSQQTQNPTAFPAATLLDPETQRPNAANPPFQTVDIEFTDHCKTLLENATLDASNLDPEVIDNLRNPPKELPDTSDKYFRLALDCYMAVGNASRAVYDQFRTALLRCFPDIPILSYDQIRRRVEQLSGVVPIIHDMCIDSCVAFTGPWSDHEECPLCGKARYDPDKLVASGGKVKEPRLQFHTIPIGPQLQARRRHPVMAEKMRHRDRRVRDILANLDSNGTIQIDVYEDVYHGSDLLNAIVSGVIKATDSILLLSIDGAQLYKNKSSDCWIYIWVLLDLPPDLRYKKSHILPGGFIPGPNKPKNLDSFLFPGLYHLAAIQKEGLRVWDASTQQLESDHPFLAFASADTPAMALMDGMVGHHGRFGCRFYCPMKGRNKTGAPHYYPACLLPDNYSVAKSNHPDVSLRTLTSLTSQQSADRYEKNLKYVRDAPTAAEYKRRRLKTGICKPSIFSGLPRFLGVPASFPADMMHLASLNLPDLLISLWRGTIECDRNHDSKDSWAWFVLRDKIWKSHGQTVAATSGKPSSVN